MKGLAVVGGGAAGGFIGWWVGLFLCPDWGDLGMNALTWCVGGAVVGAAIGVFASTELVS